jgi:hypothetical protein
MHTVFFLQIAIPLLFDKPPAGIIVVERERESLKYIASVKRLNLLHTAILFLYNTVVFFMSSNLFNRTVSNRLLTLCL